MDIQKTIEFILEHQAHFATQLEEMRLHQLAAEERHDREMAAIRSELRRAIRLSIEEHRRERVRRHELEKQHKELTETLQRFIESMKQPPNGSNGQG